MAAATAIFKDNIEFKVLLNIQDFNDGRDACQDLDSPSELASFASLEEYNFIVDTIDTIDEGIEFLWIGLDRDFTDDDLSPSELADEFEFLDGTPNVITNTPFVFPWASNEPSRNDQFCAAISIDFGNGEFQTLDDQPCGRNNGNQGAVCKRYLADRATQVAADGSFQITVVTLPDENNEFDAAIEACADLDPPGLLASFSNEDEFNLILDTIHLVPPLVIAWVGLKRGPDEDGIDAPDFTFLDGTSNDFTSVGNQFPWANDEPNNAIGNQECGCISYALDVPNTLEDIQCNGQESEPSGAVCKQLLQGSPTGNPTRNPTQSPSKNPTQSPSKNPTRSPTKKPTQSPSGNPTKNPTKGPTKNPTPSPVDTPTPSPTENPTGKPTGNPTENPTKNPTKKPTDSPTFNPVAIGVPTANPTAAPSILEDAEIIAEAEVSFLLFGAALLALSSVVLVILLKELKRKKDLEDELAFLFTT